MKRLNLFHLFILCVAAFCFTACEKEDLNDTKETTKPVTAKLIVTYMGDTTRFSSESNVFAIDSKKKSGYPVTVNNKAGFYTTSEWVKQGGDRPTINDDKYESSTVLIQKNGLISRTYTCTTSDIACLCYYEDFSITKHLPDYAQHMKGTITVNIKAYIQNRLQREVTYKVDRNAPEAWIIFYSDKSYLTQEYDNDGLHNINNDEGWIHIGVGGAD